MPVHCKQERPYDQSRHASSDILCDLEQKAAVELVFASQGMARPYILPPGTPQPIIAIWRKAFAEMLADPAFEADLKKLNLDFETPMNGPQVEAMIARLYATPEDVLSKVNGLMAIK